MDESSNKVIGTRKKVQFKVWIESTLKEKLKTYSKQTHQDLSRITEQAIEHFLSVQSFLKSLEIKLLEVNTTQIKGIQEQIEQLTRFNEEILHKLEGVVQARNDLSSILKLETEYNIKLQMEKTLAHALFILARKRYMKEVDLLDQLQEAFPSTPLTYLMVSLQEGTTRGYITRNGEIISLASE